MVCSIQVLMLLDCTWKYAIEDLYQSRLCTKGMQWTVGLFGKIRRTYVKVGISCGLYRQRFSAIVKVRRCKKEYRSKYYYCSRSSTEKKSDKIEHRQSWLRSLLHLYWVYQSVNGSSMHIATECTQLQNQRYMIRHNLIVTRFHWSYAGNLK